MSEILNSLSFFKDRNPFCLSVRRTYHRRSTWSDSLFAVYLGNSAKRQDIPRIILHSLFLLNYSFFLLFLPFIQEKLILLFVLFLSLFFILPFLNVVFLSYNLSYNTEPVPREGQNNVRVTHLQIVIITALKEREKI